MSSKSSSRATDLDAFLVRTSRGVVLGLVELVGDSAESTRGTASDRVVGTVALGLLFIGLLGDFRGVALERLCDVVAGVLDGVGNLADDAFVWLINVWSRHDEVDLVERFLKLRFDVMKFCLRIDECRLMKRSTGGSWAGFIYTKEEEFVCVTSPRSECGNNHS
jgi:hypothetical protein